MIDETGRITGYKTSAGADTVFPFSSFKKIASDQGAGGAWTAKVTVDCTTIPNYKQLTDSNFILEIVQVQNQGNGGGNLSPLKNYDPATGILTLSNLARNVSYQNAIGMTVNVWVMT